MFRPRYIFHVPFVGKINLIYHLVDTFFSYLDSSLRFFSVHVLSSAKYLLVEPYKSFGNNIYIVC